MISTALHPAIYIYSLIVILAANGSGRLKLVGVINSEPFQFNGLTGLGITDTFIYYGIFVS